MGYKFVSADAGVAFIGGKKVYADKAMAAGSLMLVDPSHSLGAFSGVPASGGIVPNIARDVAAGLTGVSASLMDPSCIRTDTATDLIAERTTKGGLHVMCSQSTMAASRYFGLRYPTDIINYVYTHMDNVYALFLWRKVTRLGLVAGTNPYHYLGNAPGVNQGLITLLNYGTSPSTTSAVRTLTGASDQNTLANMNEQVKATGWSGTKPTNVSQVGFNLAVWGNGGAGPWGLGGQNTSPSSILYRIGLEDLTATAAARTANGEPNATVTLRYAELQTLDLADWTTAFASGGRYYGDTYSTPATVIP